MALTADQILEHVLALPPRERLKLVERVIHEAAESADADEGEEAMDLELARRIELAEEGHMSPADEVMARLRARRAADAR